MFNDKYGLTQAVLEGRKTQTRRLIKCRKTFKGEWVAGFNIHIRPSDKKVVGLPCMYDADEREFEGGEILPKYDVGEVVAVAQSYKDCLAENPYNRGYFLSGSAGWNNKMFTRADVLPHQICITNVHVEHLQDISDENCIKEGVHEATVDFPWYWIDGSKATFNEPRTAFAHLINKVSRKNVWEENPYVFVYDFEHRPPRKKTHQKPCLTKIEHDLDEEE